MITKRIATGALLCSLALAPAQRAVADGGDFALGVAAGVIGSAVVRDMKKKNQAKAQQQAAPVASSSGSSSATRSANREVQTALNYFGFPVGTPDGVLGRNSRAGIADFQTYMGYPVTGQLTAYQQDFLVSSYSRALAGGASTDQAIAANPQGAKGLLSQWSTVAVAPAATTAGQVPSFLAQSGGATSLSAYCAQVEAATSGVVSASADPNAILSSDFCNARATAISDSTALMAQVQGYSPAQIDIQCDGFGPVLRDYVTALGQDPEAQVLERVSGWTRSSGLDPDVLAGTAQVCLGSGYARDNLDVAIGSALVLTALGQGGYAELPGHHLSQGFGVPRRPDLALDWYEAALAAPVAVFAPGDVARMDALRRAAYSVAGRADTGAVPTFATGGALTTKAVASP
jgi:peptidoglycan hydrolase-like protein with peptidoglycan-binding domain